MVDFRIKRDDEQGLAKIRAVPIAVTPEGFWCCPCPSQAVLQKTLKNQNSHGRQKPSFSEEKTQEPLNVKKRFSTELRSWVFSDDPGLLPSENPKLGSGRRSKSANAEACQQKTMFVGFGQQESSDLKVVLTGREGASARVSVHRDVLVEHSKFFSDKLSSHGSYVPHIEIGECDDVEAFVDTIGLMYCKEIKQRMVGQSVPHVLSIMKIAESLGFHLCIKSCLEYLEAVPWVGEEEEKNVVSSIRNLADDDYGVSPLMRRVSSAVSAPNNTLGLILDLVLKSKEEIGRREMKSLVLRLLHENGLLIESPSDICIDNLYSSCESCLCSMSVLFRQVSDPGFGNEPFEARDPVVRQVTLEVDNLIWLVDILADRHKADDFVGVWASQDGLAALHSKLPANYRHLLSRITARLFVGVGKGEMLPSKEARQLLLNLWLQPLINDYNWLRHDCRSFDRREVEEGIGRTILTLPLENQQDVLLSWLRSFLKVGDSCPNLQKAFEIWWRRAFIRPHLEQQLSMLQ